MCIKTLPELVRVRAAYQNIGENIQLLTFADDFLFIYAQRLCFVVLL